VLWHCSLGGRKGIRPVKNGGWWRWALVSLDGVAPSRTVSVSASVNLPLHRKVQKFSSGSGSPGWSRKKGRKTVVVVVVNSLTKLVSFSFDDFYSESVKHFSVLGHLPFIWSRGMPTFSSFLTSGRTPALKSIGLETCSWVCGSRICSWGVSRTMKTGLWCVRMNVPDFLKSGVKSLKHSTSSK